MAPETSRLAQLFPAELRGLLLRWQQRSGCVRDRSPERLLEECGGALWLESRRWPLPDWERIVRRVVYREWEKPGRRPIDPLPESLPAHPPTAGRELPHRFPEWEDRFVSSRGHPRRAGREAGWTRAETRLRLRLVVRSLVEEDAFHHALRCRAARLLARAAREGATGELRRQAGRILSVWAQIQPPESCRQARVALRRIRAAGRTADDPDRPESASG